MEDREVININSRVIDMQAIEFESIIEDHSIPVPESVILKNGLPVRVIVLFDEVKQSASKSKAVTVQSPPLAKGG
jgi:hypothetical protein